MPPTASIMMIPKPQFDMSLFHSLSDQAGPLKQMIGNAVYSAIVSYVSEAYAGKITGMVIDE